MKLHGSSIYQLAASAGCALLVTLAVSTAFAAEPETKTDTSDSAVAAEPLPLDVLREFTDAYARIKNDYVEDVDDSIILKNAIRGMLAGLDPHSTYLDSEDFEDIKVGTSGEFGGLGIEVGMEDGFVKVVAPIDDTPAERAGVQAGDLIIRLDDTPVKGMSLDDAVNHMRGKVGSKILLTIVREGSDRPLKISITRDIIKVTSVKHDLLEPNYGYVRISHFQAHTGEQLEKALVRLKKKNEGALKGVILDLRNNPGGVLSAAVDVSDAFLNSGMVVYTEGRIEDSQLKFSANPGDLINGAPLIILVNGGSASASEIVAGALQDHSRAIIMGKRTFGKGSVQTILPLGQETAVKLTTARYFTPNGRSIQAEGIEPDIELENVRLAAQKENGFGRLKEADLSGHLSNGNGENGNSSDDHKSEQKDDDKSSAVVKKDLSNDYPLHEALSLLKGLTIIQAQQQNK